MLYHLPDELVEKQNIFGDLIGIFPFDFFKNNWLSDMIV